MQGDEIFFGAGMVRPRGPAGAAFRLAGAAASPREGEGKSGTRSDEARGDPVPGEILQIPWPCGAVCTISSPSWWKVPQRMWKRPRTAWGTGCGRRYCMVVVLSSGVPAAAASVPARARHQSAMILPTAGFTR